MTTDGWRWESLDGISRGGLFTDGDWVESKDQDPNGHVRLTQLADVGVGEFRHRSDRWMRDDQATRLKCSYLRQGDVLIARMPDPIGRACLVPDGLGHAVTAVDVAILRVARPEIDARYVMWAINSPAVHQAIVAMQSGTTRRRISRKNLATIRIPIPSLAEQRRIVAILEEHLSDLSSGLANLASSKARLRSLRLRTLEDMVPAGTPIDSLASVALDSGYGTSAKCVAGGAGPAVVRIPNLVGGRVNLDDEKRSQDGRVDLSSYMLQEGDLLIVRTNGSKDLIGRSAVVQERVSAAFASYLIRFRLDESKVRPEWVRLMLERPSTRAELESLAASSAGQYNLSLGKLNPLQIPVPPLSAQAALMAAWAEQAAVTDRLGEAIDNSVHRANSLHRAILAAAFSSRLTGRGSDTDVISEVAEEESA